MNFPKIRIWMRTTRRDPDRIIFERSRAKVQAHNSPRAQQRFCEVFQIRDGKITGLQIYFDVANLLTYVDVAGLLQEFRLRASDRRISRWRDGTTGGPQLRPALSPPLIRCVHAGPGSGRADEIGRSEDGQRRRLRSVILHPDLLAHRDHREHAGL
jgi:hypothetical protein